ncbi:MAG: pseudouridine-5'-phosphate glycosidase [Thermotogota bacterium]|mgnify:FL=1
MKDVIYKVSEEVERALLDDKPVVALESTVISHGLPYPENIQTALKMEEIVRKEGSIPATIGVVNGVITVGLSQKEIEYLADTSHSILKVGIGELDYAIGMERSAATTVSATSWIAHFFKIPIFATGGIGGVHRGVEKTWDVSQDMQGLGRIPVMVVCAGAKSILDLPKTLELLESYGVLTVGYQTDHFPAFYSRESPMPLAHSVQTPGEAACVLLSRLKTGIPGGIVLCNPIPKEEEIPYDELESIINEAVVEAERQGVEKKALTPFLLSNVSQKTAGRSLKANKALLFHNGALASKVAVEFSTLRRRSKKTIGF